jgi:hypothetical protein
VQNGNNKGRLRPSGPIGNRALTMTEAAWSAQSPRPECGHHAKGVAIDVEPPLSRRGQ